MSNFNYFNIMDSNSFKNTNISIHNKNDNILKKDFPNIKSIYDLKTSDLVKNIHLTKTEEDIFDLILEVIKKNNLNVTCRVAGGWVRDKLLGKKSDDIDIAIDNISGEIFAKHIHKEINKNNNTSNDILSSDLDSNSNISKIEKNITTNSNTTSNTKSKIKKDKENSSSVGVIKSNPEKSKHLETATMKIKNLWIDFVNLRTEIYSDNSRVPEIKKATPLEDAERRDITINSMFYNINTKKIEDFLGKGIQDLKDGLIRTPVNAEITFKDDPLRILRVIRFATRYQFNIDNEIFKAAFNINIKKALKDKNKISNERIKKELSLMFKGKLPYASIRLLYELNLLEELLKIPEIEEYKCLDIKSCLLKSVEYSYIANDLLNNSKNIFLDVMNKNGITDSLSIDYYNMIKSKIDSIDNTVVDKINNNTDLNVNINESNESKKFNEENIIIYNEFRERLFFLCIILPFKNINYKTKKDVISLSHYIYKESFVATNESLKINNLLLLNFDVFIELINKFEKHKIFNRLDWGLLIRKVTSQNLKIFFYIGIIYKYNIENTKASNSFYINNDNINKLIQLFDNVSLKIKESNLLGIDLIKPLIQGSEIAKIFNISPGKKIGALIEKQIESIINNPSITRVEIIELLKNYV